MGELEWDDKSVPAYRDDFTKGHLTFKEEMIMRKSIVSTLITLWVVIGLFACGGGGGGGGNATPTTTPIGTTVNLSQVKNFSEAQTPGSTMSFNVVGSSSAGDKLTGTLSLSISAPAITATSTGSQIMNISTQNVTLTNTSNGAFASGMSTYYCYQNGYFYEEVYSDGRISIPISQTLLPSSAKVGDFGADMVVSNSDGTTETSTWRIDPDTNGDSKFVYVYTTRDSSNVVTGTEEDAYTIKPDGSISAVSSKIYYPSTGITVTLSGNKN
jgi:hypothetical protein